MSSQHILDRYKVPRESVNVEALAQQVTRYLKITTEDIEFLSDHPARRDELFAELYKHPDVKSGISANQFVSLGGDPDTHLIPANAEIERLTPPKTLEDRVARLHVAMAALMVFNQYKLMYALLDHPDLERKVDRRKTQIMNEWYETEFVRLFPAHAARRASRTSTSTQVDRLQVATPTPHTPPGPGPAPPASATRHSGIHKRSIPNDEVEQFLSSPSTLLGTRFLHSPPQDQLDRADRGAWEVASYTVRKGDTGVEHEFQVLFDALGGDPLPMDEGEVRTLLRYSTLAV